MDKILFVRRDNIGDLVCTTPAIRAARLRFPKARISALVNSYNVEAVSWNPDINEIYVYEKEKHALDRSRVSVWLENMKVFREIRKARYDCAIACGGFSPTLARYAFLTGAGLRVGYAPKSGRLGLYNRPVEGPAEGLHEVERTFNLLKAIGIEGEPGDMVLVPDAEEQMRFGLFKREAIKYPKRPLLAVLISARKAAHAWPLHRFKEFIQRIGSLAPLNIVLLWAPGSRQSAAFPGDDEGAEEILRDATSMAGVFGYKTLTLKSLISAISFADLCLTLDTGSMHISAGLKKPTIALMLEANVPQWRPWRVDSSIVTAVDRVSDIRVESVLQATVDIMKRHGLDSGQGMATN
jgi:ADP-heptose:LPS heptosyltransferase